VGAEHDHVDLSLVRVADDFNSGSTDATGAQHILGLDVRLFLLGQDVPEQLARDVLATGHDAHVAEALLDDAFALHHRFQIAPRLDMEHGEPRLEHPRQSDPVPDRGLRCLT
jgi:hypothetical protein